MTGGLIAAVIAGAFCAVFAVLVNAVLRPVMDLEVPISGAISGFCGSLFARHVLKRNG